MFQKLALVLLVLFFRTSFCAIDDSGFNVSVIHLNDFHARFDEVTINSTSCPDNETDCIGGMARLYTIVSELLENQPNSLFLNIGDNFQGTLWYNIFKWNVTQYFLNKLPIDAYTIGNHEFDDAIDGLVPFLKSLNAPVVVSNIDASTEPDLVGLFNKSVVVVKNGVRIGLIGVILQSTPNMAQTEDLIFLPESASVNEEADRLVSENLVDTIIVISHCGYTKDIEIASNASSKISLVVGAHSHTFLYTGSDPPGPDTPSGDYPTVVKLSNGGTVLVVQASAYTKYLGNITVFYNSSGEVVSWDGAPIYLDSSVEKDEQMVKELEPWKAVVDEYGNVIVGETLVRITRGCYNKECLMGNLVADSYAKSYKGSSSALEKYPVLGFVNAAGIRSTFYIGNITYSDVVRVQPFENTCDFGELQGKYLLEALKDTEADTLLQVSEGLRLNYSTKTYPRKLVSAEVYCSGCQSPGYVPIDEDDYFVVVFPSFFKTVGRWSGLYTNITGYTVGDIDSNVFSQYLSQISPIEEVGTGRMFFSTGDEEEEQEENATDSSGSLICSGGVLVLIFIINLKTYLLN